MLDKLGNRLLQSGFGQPQQPLDLHGRVPDLLILWLRDYRLARTLRQSQTRFSGSIVQPVSQTIFIDKNDFYRYACYINTGKVPVNP